MVKMIVLLHGAPGSGKSFLADKLAKEHSGQVFTTDDFFMKDNKYQFLGSFISAAHQWCFGNVAKAIFNGLPYIVVANTNLQKWQIEPYVDLAAKNGYDFKIVEPKTKWRYKADELAKRNTHGVPLASIERMLNDREDPKEMEKILRNKYYKS